MVDIGELYESSRRRVQAVIGSEGRDAGARAVPACPGWTVTDVVAHLVGVIEDAAAGRIDGVPGAEQTADQVARHRDDALGDLLARWAQLAPPFEEALTALQIVPAFVDVLSHEHDVRGALDRRGDQDDPGVVFAARRLATIDDVSVRIELVPDAPAEPSRITDEWVLRATAFEVFRLRLGRRTRAQVRALSWSADPEPILDRLFVFGPAAQSLTD